MKQKFNKGQKGHFILFKKNNGLRIYNNNNKHMFTQNTALKHITTERTMAKYRELQNCG